MRAFTEPSGRVHKKTPILAGRGRLKSYMVCHGCMSCLRSVRVPNGFSLIIFSDTHVYIYIHVFIFIYIRDVVTLLLSKKSLRLGEALFQRCLWGFCSMSSCSKHGSTSTVGCGRKRKIDQIKNPQLGSASSCLFYRFRAIVLETTDLAPRILDLVVQSFALKTYSGPFNTNIDKGI